MTESTCRILDMNEKIVGRSMYYIHLWHEHKMNPPKEYASQYLEHFHVDHEILLVLSGSGYHTVMGTRYEIRPFDLFLIKPGEHHFVEIDMKPCPYDRIVFHFQSEQLFPPEIQKSLWALPHVINIADTALLKEFRRTDRLMDNVAADYRGSAIRGQLEIIVSMLCSNVFEEPKAVYVNSELSSILAFIDDNIADIGTSEDLADRLMKSSSSIQKLFASEMHISPMSYIRMRRCHMAKEMIDSGTPAKVVYRQCGFKTYSTFYRDYMKIYGTAPTGDKTGVGTDAV